MKQFIDSVKYIVEHGEKRKDRTGTGTLGVFGYNESYDLTKGFPLATHRRAPWKSIVAETVWFLSGSTNVKILQTMGCKFWDEWADDTGSIGPMYGNAWRGVAPAFSVDQIAEILMLLKADPWSRRMVLNSWAADRLPLKGTKAPSENAKFGHMVLAPCHPLIQFYVSNDYKISAHLYLRSNDVLLGKIANIASYALIVHILAALCGYGLGTLHIATGDMHIYNDHIESGALDAILKAPTFDLPTLDVTDALAYAKAMIDGLDDISAVHEYSHILNVLFIQNNQQTLRALQNSLTNYKHGKDIKMKVSV